MPDMLEKMILQHKSEGRTPFFVNCTAGTTVMGAFDPINAIADICKKHNIWLHIDVILNFSAYFELFTKHFLIGC